MRPLYRRAVLAAAAAHFDAAGEAAISRLRRRPAADRVMYGASRLGDGGKVWIVLAGVLSLRAEHPRNRFAHVMIWLGIESLVVNAVLKPLIRRPRPAGRPGAHPHTLRRARYSSFPSGHSASAGTMATVLSDGEPVAGPLLWGLAGLIAASRVHVGVHHPTDVVAGLATGVAIGAVARITRPDSTR